MELGIAEKGTWQQPEPDTVHIFCDAAGDPAQVAAIGWDRGETLYADCEPSAAITQRWRERSDNSFSK